MKTQNFLILGLFLTSFFCVETGNSKLIVPYVFIEITTVFYLFTEFLRQEEILFLVQFGLAHLSLLVLLRCHKLAYRIIIPLVFVLSYLHHNFSDFSFIDWEYALISLLPFLTLWFLLLKNSKQTL